LVGGAVSVFRIDDPKYERAAFQRSLLGEGSSLGVGCWNLLLELRSHGALVANHRSTLSQLGRPLSAAATAWLRRLCPAASLTPSVGARPWFGLIVRCQPLRQLFA
jgi:hypothetical protein